MITIPSVLCYKDIVVYPDDKDCNLFYCIRTTPRIRTENGAPVFSGLFYSDDLSGTMKTTAGIAGAFINFDVNLAISREEYDNIREQIKSHGIQETRVNAIKKKDEERYYYLNRNKDSNASSSNPTGYDIPTIGEIRFGSINFKNGTVELLEEKAGGEGALVAWSSSDTGNKCSMFGDNNAAFALRLTHLGGAVWYKALKQRSKAFSVRYNLSFEVRVPCLEIHIYASSLQGFDLTRKVERIWKNVDKGCTHADVERIDCSAITQMLKDESLIHIDIVQGSSNIPMEDVQSIQQSMLSIVQSKVEEIIKSKIQGMTPEERKESMIEKITEEINSFAELRFTQESVMEWSIAPQCTIMNFLEGVPEKELGRILTLIDLSVPELEYANIDVNVSAPWMDDIITHVDVHLKYVATGEEKTLYFDNSKQDTQHWKFRPNKDKMIVKKDEGKVRFTAEVWTRWTKTKAEGGTGPYVIPERETSGNVFVNVGKIGVADVKFVADPLLSTLKDDNEVKSIVVKTRYRTREERLADEKDMKSGIVPEIKRGVSGDYPINLQTWEYDYHANFGQPINEPLLYQVAYSFKNRAPITLPEQQYYFSEGVESQCLLAKPFVDSLDIDVDVSGSIRNNQNIVSADAYFKYVDEKEGFESTGKAVLKKEDNWESSQAKLLICNAENKKFQYRYVLHMTDDDYHSDWMNGEGEGETVILTAPKAFVVDTGLLGIAGTDYYRAELNVVFKGEGIESLHFSFDKNESSEIRYWYIPQKLSEIELSYNYVFKYYDKRGQEHEISGENTGYLLMIVKPEAPEPSEASDLPETPKSDE